MRQNSSTAVKDSLLLEYPVFPELEPMCPVLPEPMDLPLFLVASCQIIWGLLSSAPGGLPDVLLYPPIFPLTLLLAFWPQPSAGLHPSRWPPSVSRHCGPSICPADGLRLCHHWLPVSPPEILNFKASWGGPSKLLHLKVTYYFLKPANKYDYICENLHCTLMYSKLWKDSPRPHNLVRPDHMTDTYTLCCI